MFYLYCRHWTDNYLLIIMNGPPPTVNQLHNGELSQILNGEMPSVADSSLFQNELTPATVYSNIPLSPGQSYDSISAPRMAMQQHPNLSHARDRSIL